MPFIDSVSNKPASSGLNPETRTLFQVTIEDAAKAEKMVSLLMGDVVEPRKNYMYKYAEF